MTHIYLSLGTNLGDRQHNLQQALSGLAAFMTITAVSPVYETRPWGPIQDQPNFYNLCLGGDTSLSPTPFLAESKRLEEKIGRVDGTRWGPRLIDIDLLFHGRTIMREELLILPHRQLAQRAFVLVPLADIAPEFTHPQSGQTVRDMLALLPQKDIDDVQPLSVSPAALLP